LGKGQLGTYWDTANGPSDHDKEYQQMTRMDEIITQSSCALCGKGVHIDNHEGRVACNGCGMATDNCTCEPES